MTAAAPAPPALHAGDDADAAAGDTEEQQGHEHQLAALRSLQGQARDSAGGGTDSSAPPPAPSAEAQLLQHPKHVFVFSTAGKPIFTYRGDEARLAGLVATAQAILSVAHSKGHTLKHTRCRAGRG